MAIHRCSVCKKTGEWTKEWCWYGSYKQLDDFGGDGVPKMCSEACKAKWAKKNRIPEESGQLVSRKPGRRSR